MVPVLDVSGSSALYHLESVYVTFLVGVPDRASILNTVVLFIFAGAKFRGTAVMGISRGLNFADSLAFLYKM